MVYSEYQSSDWECDYVYLYGLPIARLWVENIEQPLYDSAGPPPGGGELLSLPGGISFGGVSMSSSGPGGGGLLSLPGGISFGGVSMSSSGPGPGGGSGTVTVSNYDISYYHTDHLGTPLMMTDKNQRKNWETGYYPFGGLNNEQVYAKQNNLRFPGQYHDDRTGDNDLYYNYHRYYDPKLGRYITSDPIGLAGGINLFSYAGNNPINSIDPLGLDWYEMSNGDLRWYDLSIKTLPLGYGVSWYASGLKYTHLENDGTAMTKEINHNIQSFIPNVTSGFRIRMSAAKSYGYILRFTPLQREAGMIAGYAPHMLFDIKRQKPYENCEYVRLFGEVMAHDDPGNILFGYGAAAAGYSKIEAVLAGGIVQTLMNTIRGRPRLNTPMLDELKDTGRILQGYWIYKSGGTP